MAVAKTAKVGKSKRVKNGYELEKSKKCGKPIPCLVLGCKNRQGGATYICKPQNYLRHLWQKHGFKDKYCCNTCDRFFWCADSLFSHKVKTHGESMEECTCTTAHWEGTEKVWLFLDKKAKQLKHSEKGDVMLKNNDKLNNNHESLTKLYPVRVKKGKEIKAPKENKSEQVKMPKAKRAKGVGSRLFLLLLVWRWETPLLRQRL